MSNYFANKYYINTIENLLSESGFVRHEKRYPKLIEYVRLKDNYVVQWIRRTTSPMGGGFTFDISIYPLYLGFDTIVGIKDIYGLRIGQIVYGYDKWYEYEPNNKESIKEAIDSAANDFKIKVLPLLDLAGDAIGCLKYINSINLIVKNNLYELYIKLRMYEDAKESLELNIVKLQEYWKDIQTQGYPYSEEQYERYRKYAEANMEKCQYLLESIHNKDYSALLEYVEKNEEISLTACKKFFGLDL